MPTRDPNLGQICLTAALQAHQNGNNAEAFKKCEEGLRADPDRPDGWTLLGILHRRAGDLEKAEAAYRKAISLPNEYADSHFNLGNLLKSQDKLEQALKCFSKTVSLRPKWADAHNALSDTFRLLERHAEAEAAARRAIEIDPRLAGAYSNLGNTLLGQGKFQEAEACYRNALQIQPDFPEGHYNLGDALLRQGNPVGAAESYRKALMQRPSFNTAHSNLLFTLQYDPAQSPTSLLAEHLKWEEQHALPRKSSIHAHTNVLDPNRRIKIGYVSSDFNQHPVGYFLSPVFPAHDRSQVEIYCYAAGGKEDSIRAHLRKYADHWCTVSKMSEEVLAEQIRKDQIDILVDLSGHTAGNRLIVFARKPAPIQATWAGYVGTTGLSAMDYLISDPRESPEGAERWGTEKIVRLPECYVCYAPPAYAPAVGPLPAISRGFLTFGCFNNLVKIHSGVIALWSHVLRACPGSRLVMRTHQLVNSAVRSRYHALFEQYGISRGRIDLFPVLPHPELLASYNEIDLALDPFPYSGGLTTLESIWMGVPVITLGGDRFCSRHSLSHLTAAGLAEFIAEDAEQYLSIAQQWSRNISGLATLRAGLRARMSISPLCDGSRFAKHLESTYREMWKTWCTTQVQIKAEPTIRTLRIAFVDLSSIDYRIDTPYQHPLGGSQSALCYLSEELVKLGHQVFLFNQTSNPGESRGVQCVGLQVTANLMGRFDAFVVLNDGEGVIQQRLRSLAGPGVPIIAWIQHDTDQASVLELAKPEVRNGWDAFALISGWQAAAYYQAFQIETSKIHVLRNAVSPCFQELLKLDRSILSQKSKLPVLCYTSTPYRGLDVLLDAFPRIRAEIPEVRLQVYSSLKVYQLKDKEHLFQKLYDSCRTTPGVEYFGSVSQKELAEALRACTMLAYPNTYPETSCISVMEAMAAGCTVLTTALGALPETTAGYAELLPYTKDKAAHALAFSEAAVILLKSLQDSPESVEKHLQRQIQYVQEHLTWKQRAKEWAHWLTKVKDFKNSGV